MPRSSFSAPRATTINSLSGNGLCSAFASSHGARIQTSCSSSLVRITGIAFEWIGSTMAFGDVEAVDEVRAGDRFGLGAPISLELCPDTGESE
jgi:hypothetical protein